MDHLLPENMSDIIDNKNSGQSAFAGMQLQAVLDAASCFAIIITGMDGIITFFNRAAEVMLGYRPEEVVGRVTPLQFLSPFELKQQGLLLSSLFERDFSGFQALIANSEAGHIRKDEWTLVRKDGDQLVAKLNLTPIRDSHDKVSGYLAIVEDITERKAMEQQLRENEQLLKTIIESIPSPVFYKDAAGRYTGCNEAFVAYLGLPREKIVNATVFDISPGPQAEIYHRADMELFEKMETQRYEASVRYADNTMHDVIFYKSAMKDENGKLLGLVGVMLDISELKLVEAEKDRLCSELLHAQKIESIGRLAGGVAHDFNNLLTPIIGYAEMLQNSTAADERSQKRVQGILAAASKARDLTRQLLAFSRKQVLEMKDIDLNRLVMDFTPILEHTIRQDIKINLELDALPAVTTGDQTQIEQVIMNLAINAQDAMPDGGSLMIRTSRGFIDIQPENDSELPAGSYVILTVSDDGEGMLPEIMDHIFEPFYTTKSSSKGTGLGLATVFGIVKQHGGQICVTSEPGHGTTFTIYLPLRQFESESNVVPETCAVWGHHENKTILLVEDNQMVMNMTCELLTEKGYNVLTANSAKEATELIRKHAHSIDLLLTDVIMPGMSGPALYESIRAIYSGLKVVFMSGYSDNIIEKQLQSVKELHYIHKPFTPEAIIAKINEAFSR